MSDILTSAGLRKDTSNLIECRIDSCNASDTFLIANYGNQSKYRIIGRTILGEFEVQSTSGETQRTIRQNAIVWRNKTLCEILVAGNEKNTIAPEHQQAKQESIPERKSNLLVDLFKHDENEIDIINFI